MICFYGNDEVGAKLPIEEVGMNAGIGEIIVLDTVLVEIDGGGTGTGMTTGGGFDIDNGKLFGGAEVTFAVDKAAL